MLRERIKKGGVMLRFTLVFCTLFTIMFLSVMSRAGHHGELDEKVIADQEVTGSVLEYPQQQW